MVKGIEQFSMHFATEPSKNLKPFGLGNTKLNEIIELIKTIYGLRS
jgi:hypothetical protein